MAIFKINNMLWMCLILCLGFNLVSMDTTKCPDHCVCLKNLTVIDCKTEFSAAIPLNLPPTTRELRLRRSFTGPVLNDTFSRLVALETLDLTNNHIHYLQGGALKNLNKLKNLILSRNMLELLDLNLFKNTLALEVLDLSFNKLRFLPDTSFRFLANFKFLNVSYNYLTSARLGFGFQVTTQLRVLDFSGNNIRRVEPGDLDTVTSWDARVPKVLNFSACNLQYLHPAALGLLRNVETLSLAHNLNFEIRNISAYFPVLQTVCLKKLDLSYTNLSSKVNTSLLTSEGLGPLSIEELKLAGNDFREIGPNFLSYLLLKKLDLSFNQLQALSDGIASLSSFTHLDLSHNKISTISEQFKENSFNLMSLLLSHNRLGPDSDLDLSLAVKLTTLDLSYNRLTSVSIPESLEDLRYLNLAGNGLTSLQQLSGLRSLREINVEENSLTELGMFLLVDSAKIEVANFRKNQISVISHQAFLPNSPAVIDLSHNAIDSVRHFGWHDMVHLNLQHNNVKEIDSQAFYFLHTLQDLDLSWNSLTILDIDTLSHLTNLTTLSLAHNHLNDDQPLPELLKPLESLENIDLSFNNFTKLLFPTSPFRNCKKLRSVRVSNNKITHLESYIFSHLKYLEEADFSRNPFHCSCRILGFQNWIAEMNNKIRFQSNQFYRCKTPGYRKGQLVKDFTVRQFECNRYLFFIVIFTSTGGAIMVIAIATAVICHMCLRRRKKKRDSKTIDMVDFKALNGNAAAVRENYLKHSPSDTLIDVQFETPTEKKENCKKSKDNRTSDKKKSKQKKTKKKAKSTKDKANAKEKRKQIEKWRHYADMNGLAEQLKEVRFIGDHGYNNLHQSLASTADTEYNIRNNAENDYLGNRRRHGDEIRRKRRPRGNRDLVRLLSDREYKSVPDIVGYVNSIPRRNYHSRYRYQKIPIVHVDHGDGQHGWLRSMVDLPRHSRSHSATYLVDDRLPRSETNERKDNPVANGYIHVANGYGTLPSMHRTVSGGTRPVVPGMGTRTLGRGRSNSMSANVSEWV